MLLRKDTLEGIQGGKIDLVFRRWTRPTVKTRGSLRPAAGLRQIDRIEKVERGDIPEDEARRAGLELDELLAFLDQRGTGDIYLLELGSIAPDLRIALRENDDLSDLDAMSSSRGWIVSTGPASGARGRGAFSYCWTRTPTCAPRTCPTGR